MEYWRCVGWERLRVPIFPEVYVAYTVRRIGDLDRGTEANLARTTGKDSCGRYEPSSCGSEKAIRYLLGNINDTFFVVSSLSF